MTLVVDILGVCLFVLIFTKNNIRGRINSSNLYSSSADLLTKVYISSFLQVQAHLIVTTNIQCRYDESYLTDEKLKFRTHHPNSDPTGHKTGAELCI